MPAEEIAFRVAYEGPLSAFTRENPGVHIALWCDWKREVVQVAGADGPKVEALRDILRKHSKNLEAYPMDDATQVMVLDCVGLPHDFVNEAVDDAHCLSLGPTRFEEGWEVYDVVSFSETKARGLFAKLRAGGRDVELLHRRQLKVQPLLSTRGAAVSGLFEDLTDRQLGSLLLAHKHGLYTSPRRTTAAAIADAQGLSRSTFEEHVRKAESKVIANLVPHLELALRARRAAQPARR